MIWKSFFKRSKKTPQDAVKWNTDHKAKKNKNAPYPKKEERVQAGFHRHQESGKKDCQPQRIDQGRHGKGQYTNDFFIQICKLFCNKTAEKLHHKIKWKSNKANNIEKTQKKYGDLYNQKKHVFQK